MDIRNTGLKMLDSVANKTGVCIAFAVCYSIPIRRALNRLIDWGAIVLFTGRLGRHKSIHCEADLQFTLTKCNLV